MFILFQKNILGDYTHQKKSTKDIFMQTKKLSDQSLLFSIQLNDCGFRKNH